MEGWTDVTCTAHLAALGIHRTERELELAADEPTVGGDRLSHQRPRRAPFVVDLEDFDRRSGPPGGPRRLARSQGSTELVGISEGLTDQRTQQRFVVERAHEAIDASLDMDPIIDLDSPAWMLQVCCRAWL